MRPSLVVHLAFAAYWASSSTAQLVNCPTTTAGVSSWILDACDRLQSQLATATAATLVVTGAPQVIGESASTAATTLVLSSTASISSTSPSVSSSGAAATGTSGGAGAGQASRAGNDARPAGDSAGSRSGAQNSGDDDDAEYTSHVIIPAAVICSVLGLVLIIVAVWFLLRRRKHKRDREWAEQDHAGEYGGFVGGAGDEKESPSNDNSNEGGDESPVLPPVFQAGGASATRTPQTRTPQAMTPQVIGTPQARTPPQTRSPPNEAFLDTSSPEVSMAEMPAVVPTEMPAVVAAEGAPTFSSSGESPHTSDRSVESPWRIQPLRHFRRHSYGDDQSGSADESTIPSTFDSSSDMQTESTGTYPSGFTVGEGLVPLREETETESSVYETPVQEPEFSWLDVPEDPNRPQSSSWLSTDSSVPPPVLPELQTQLGGHSGAAEYPGAAYQYSDYHRAIAQGDQWPLLNTPGAFIPDEDDEYVESTPRQTRMGIGIPPQNAPDADAEDETMYTPTPQPRQIWIPRKPVGGQATPTSPANATPRE